MVTGELERAAAVLNAVGNRFRSRGWYMRETAQGVQRGEARMRAYPRNRNRLAVPLVAQLTALLLALPTGCVSTPGIDTSAMSFSPEPLVGKVVWNDLVTQDLDVARRFYGELFGWTFEQSIAPEGQPYLLARSGHIFVAGMVAVNSPAKDEVLSRWLPYMSVSDVDTSLAQATAAGATVLVSARDVNLG